MSTLGRTGPRLAHAHAAGLIMRHDKAVFATAAMSAVHVAKLIGDDVRIIVFSALAGAVARVDSTDIERIRHLLDPFSGSFVSELPVTVVLLRVALRTLRLFEAGDLTDAREYATDAPRRVEEALLADGDIDDVADRLHAERSSWGQFYDALDALETAIADDEDAAVGIRRAAGRIIDGCRIGARG